uniref:Enhancer of mRNA-decapping protein 3 n=1 Tax=Cacopsylla melanoneura TaxID=428564 RepID=A0A8D8YXZ2_9HEMI
MADYIGYLVEIECSDNRTFKGIVSHVDQNNLSLINVHLNGKLYNVPEITLGPKDMKNLKILESPGHHAPPKTPSTSTVTPVKRKPSNTHTEYASEPSVTNNTMYNITEQVPASIMSNVYGASQQGNYAANPLAFKQTSNFVKRPGGGGIGTGGSGVGKFQFSDQFCNNKQNKKQLTLSAKKRHEFRNDECFNQIDKELLSIDFDFEENLKLFDKISDKSASGAGHKTKKQGQVSGYYEQGTSYAPSIGPGLDSDPSSSSVGVSVMCGSDATTKPDLVSQVDQRVPVGDSGRKKKKNYRHDENILQGDSLCNNANQEISILQQDVLDVNDPGYEYVTDTGLKLPCISVELKRKILTYAEDVGLGFERQNETMARAATEMTLQLIGGAHRLSGDNRHQWPRVVILAGPHRSGAIAVGAARALASHDINTLVFLTEPDVFTAPLAHELASHRLSGPGHKVTSNVQDLPTDNIDLIISGLSSYECDSYVRRDVINYINDQKVPILGLDPNKQGIGHNVSVKYSIISVLPISYSKCNGQLYLCNLALPNGVYKDLHIQYRSPFGAKFIIPLHRK